MRYFDVFVASSHVILLFTFPRKSRIWNRFDMSFDPFTTIMSFCMACSILISRNVVLNQLVYKLVSCLRGFLVEPHTVPKSQSGGWNSGVMKSEVLISCFNWLGKPPGLCTDLRFRSDFANLGDCTI